MQRSRFDQTLNVLERFLEIGMVEGVSPFAKIHSRANGDTKCGMYLLRPSLAAALLNDLFEHPAGLPLQLQSLSSPARPPRATTPLSQVSCSSARPTMKRAAFLTPSMNVQRERTGRSKDKKEGGGFNPPPS